MRIIDAHMHLGRGDEHYGKQALWDQKAQFLADDMKALMDDVGVDHAVVFGLGRATQEDRVRPVLDAVQRYPERFTGFFWANPWESGARAAFAHTVREYGLRGLKLHPITEEKAMVLGGNIARIVGIGQAASPPPAGVSR